MFTYLTSDPNPTEYFVLDYLLGHEIKLVEGKEPGHQKIYPLSVDQQEILRKYIDTNMKRGFIRESQSPAGYPILFVPKRDEEEPRMCVDYRKLNDITIKNRYPLPLIEELRDQLIGAKVFTKFDIREAYYQVRIKEGDEWKTAFKTRYGHYEYKVMPFGLANAPATFQCLINNALREYLDIFVIAYLDDILIYSKDPKEHTEHVRKVLKALLKYNLRLKISKCEFNTVKTGFLGHIIEPGRISMVLKPAITRKRKGSWVIVNEGQDALDGWMEVVKNGRRSVGRGTSVPSNCSVGKEDSV